MVVSGRINADRGTANNAQPDRRHPGEVLGVLTVNDFTFAQYRDVIFKKTNWPRFEPVFAASRDLLSMDFEKINELRNIVFHFRRGITPCDTDRLRRFRDKLRYKRDLFNSR